MNDPLAGRRLLRFGPYELDQKAAELRKLGIRVKLPRQALDVLVLLLERPGEVVTREELRNALWPNDTFVDFDHSLNVAINRIRAVIAESGAKIDTIPRTGYRLVAAVETIDTPAQPVSGAPADARDRRSRRFWLLLTASVACAAMLVFAVVRVFASAQARSRIRSVAVLPLANLSNAADQDYFADGMTEALTTDLAKISRLHVVSATSAMQYKGAHKSLPAIGRELNVSAVIEGAVMRSAGRIRITVQLIDTAKDEHLWAESYERDLRDVLWLQRELAQTIAGEIRMRLSEQDEARFARPHKVDPQAYDAYLRARYSINRRRPAEFLKAREYLQRAVALDPDYAIAWSALAECTLLIVRDHEERRRSVDAAAHRALELDGSLGDAHLMLAMAHVFDYEWAAAEREFRRAAELSPNNSSIHDSYSMFLATMGRFDESRVAAAKALALDPFSPLVHLHVGISSFFGRRYDDAAAHLQRALEIDPGSPWAHGFLADVYRARHRDAEALAELRLAGDLPSSPDSEWQSAWSAEWKRQQARLVAGETVSPFRMAQICFNLGRNRDAIKWLERAADAHEGRMWPIAVHPLLDPLRSDPRFLALEQRLGLGAVKPAP